MSSLRDDSRSVSVVDAVFQLELTSVSRYARCGGCGHPANLLCNPLPRCPVCNTPWQYAVTCARDEFMASRADDATIPRSGGDSSGA